MTVLEQLGTFERRDDRVDLRFERFYPRSIEKVWSALTDPVRLHDWMGAAYVEPHVGGRYELMLDGPNPMTGHITAWGPPHVLAFTWSNAHASDSSARYELSRKGDGTRLIFTHEGVPHQHSALMLPGWHFFFERLEGQLNEEAVRRSNHSWRELQAIYVDHYEFIGVRLDP
jgi:uncharacterized protein YndB with AHSA1/START domain